MITSPWLIYPTSTFIIKSNLSLTTIAKQLESKTATCFGKQKKLVVTQIRDDLIYFEPTGKSIFQPVCSIFRTSENNYVIGLGISKATLHTCIIASLIPIWPLQFDPLRFLVFIPSIWIVLLITIWFTSNPARKELKAIINELSL